MAFQPRWPCLHAVLGREAAGPAFRIRGLGRVSDGLLAPLTGSVVTSLEVVGVVRDWLSARLVKEGSGDRSNPYATRPLASAGGRFAPLWIFRNHPTGEICACTAALVVRPLSNGCPTGNNFCGHVGMPPSHEGGSANLLLSAPNRETTPVRYLGPGSFRST
jgi:hypothetical protein